MPSCTYNIPQQIVLLRIQVLLTGVDVIELKYDLAVCLLEIVLSQVE